MLNVAAALKLIHREGWKESRYTLARCADQIERALLEIDTARDFANFPGIRLAALDRARTLLVGDAAQDRQEDRQAEPFQASEDSR